MTAGVSYRMGKQFAKSTIRKPLKEGELEKLVKQKLHLFTSNEEIREFKEGIKDYILELEKEEKQRQKKSLPLYNKEQQIYDGTDNNSVWCFLSMLLFGHY